MFPLREPVGKMSAYVPGEAPARADAVKLNQNENPYPPSPAVAGAIRAALGSLRLYPDSTATALREKAARVYGPRAERIMAVNGSDDWLRILFQACVGEGDEALAFDPSYSYYRTLADMYGARLRAVEFGPEYELPENLDAGRARLVFLPNPNAPSGTLFPLEEIERLLRAARPALVCVDEAYIDFAPPDATALPLLDRHDNLVVARTFSKSYGLAGLRVGLGFAREEWIEQFEKVRDYYNTDRLAQAGAAAALEDQAYLRETTGKIVRTRERAAEALRAMGAKVFPSHANFLLARFGGAAEARRLFETLRARGVYVRYFNRPRLDDCLRVTVGTDAEMDRFLDAARNALEGGA
jgi:histidinol-phosphate aminotransferase